MNPLRRRLLMLRHRGDAVRCPVCGHCFARFGPAPNRADAICWRCGSQERHRALWLFLERRPELLDGASLLHFAPEHCLRALLRDRAARYVTADLDPAGVDLRLDVTALDLPDGAFNAVICSHVLEHVGDDAAAMRELRRVTAGWCLVLVPLEIERATTYEDPAITAPAAREAAFLQADHVRLYGRDTADRLAAAGFEVETVRPREAFGDETMRRAGLLDVDWLFLCR